MHRFVLAVFCLVAVPGAGVADDPVVSAEIFRAEPDAFTPLTEPPCSYCSTQQRKGLIRPDDRVLAWVRAVHNGGAIPLRFFLSSTRVINDTYGLFFYDPDGGYVTAYEKDYGYRLYGWRRGVMVVQGEDGTLWSALTGVAFEGPQKGKRLKRIPAMLTTWSHWMTLHPESTAYDLFEGDTYHPADLPTELSAGARESMGHVDDRLEPMANVLGVEYGEGTKAYPLDDLKERDCILDTPGDEPIAVFWYEPTHTAVAWSSRVAGRQLTLYADNVAPESAPFMDRETHSRWTLAGRAVDGPLRGMELTWISSVQCRWYAWAAGYPDTEVYGQPDESSAQVAPQPEPLKAALLDSDDVTADRISELQAGGTNAIVIALKEAAGEGRSREVAAAERIRESGLDVYYWIEVARSPELADAHPEWMGSLQTHPEWRRLFEAPPVPAVDEVVKTYPWVPILTEEGYSAQLARVRELLTDRPGATGVFLNDLQGSPSACGCGNPLCRWTTDYGPLRTTTPLAADAAARFVATVREIVPASQVIPVWTTECEEHDGADDGMCAGVGCFKGICWKAYTEQLTPVAQQNDRLAVLLAFREFQRDLPVYGRPAGWIEHALHSFQTMPPQHGGEAIAPARLITILQGWDVTPDEVAAQIEVAEAAGAGGYVVSHRRINQDWEPRLAEIE